MMEANYTVAELRKMLAEAETKERAEKETRGRTRRQMERSSRSREKVP